LADYRAYATACIEALQHWYNWRNGLWKTTNWWNAANALEAIIDYTSLTGTHRFDSIITNTFEKQKKKSNNFSRDFYDDQLWWALTWVKAYDLTHMNQYLEMATHIFHNVTFAWDNKCGGGLWWDTKRSYKNAITNELFLTLAARLYKRTHAAEYLEAATGEWNWFLKSGMLNEKNLVNDGIDFTCHNNGQTTWTYNQGVILGALVEMFEISRNLNPSGQPDFSYLTLARSIADAALTTLVNANGILTEPCEANNSCGADAPQFKGIFMRNLSCLHLIGIEVIQAPVSYAHYQEFIIRNAASIWEKNRTRDNRFGLKWSGPVDRVDAARQTSALDAFNAAIPFGTSSHTT